ncbi:hypothetical protein BB560_000728 [Smittium megazygosporum]|uniref:Uncharacterized protein n=1 Tax=Smittium megazygosporum TaxID=133381 RepID=A0A2T9ZJM6_9FUNG|nr:hypothetical protein BB560_000728 [Smittium megazygosporum]
MFGDNLKFEENNVKYFIYSKNYADLGHSGTNSPTLDSQALVSQICGFINEKTRGFIWNQDDINLKIYPFVQGSYVFQGKTYFGDSIDDEWLIVWLMFEISLKFPGLAIRFPQRMNEMMHNAYCIVPRSIATLLKLDPQLISYSVQSFYTRDPVSLRHCQKMKKFPPKDLLKTLIKFNKAQYAKVMSQEFKAPAIFSLPDELDASYKASALGMKIACGFEMLYMNGSQFKNTIEKDLLASISSYVISIGKCGFFDSAGIRSSETFVNLDDSKLEFFSSLHELDDLEFESVFAVKSSLIIDEFFSRFDSGALCINFDPLLLPAEDSDKWMEVTSESLDQLFESTQRNMRNNNVFSHSLNNDDIYPEEFTSEERDAAGRLKQVVTNIESFFNTESSYKGAEYESEEFSDDFDDSADLDSKEIFFSKNEKQPFKTSLQEKYGEDVIESSDEDIDIDPNSVFDNISKLIGLDISNIGKSSDDGHDNDNDDAENSTSQEFIPTELGNKKIIDNELNQLKTPKGDKSPPNLSLVDQPKKSQLKRNEKAYLQPKGSTIPGENSKGDSKHLESTNREHISSYEEEDINSEIDFTDSEDIDVEIEENMIKNFMESFKSQQGTSGPAGTIFSQFSYNPPKNL